MSCNTNEILILADWVMFVSLLGSLVYVSYQVDKILERLK